MRLGAQMSTAGGPAMAFERGDAVGCETIMIFTKSNRQWEAPPLARAAVEQFLLATIRHPHISPVAAHASYLINLASPDKALWKRSCEALRDELDRAARLGVPYLTFHPGAATDGDEKGGLRRIAKGLKQILKQTQDTAPFTTLCLETMAGQGSQLGHQFEQLATIIERAGGDKRLGVCLDTCHIFAAGYDFRTPEGYDETIGQIEDTFGVERIACFHINDSVHPLGSRKDRHAHIGKGEIGLDGFRHFLLDPRWEGLPAHLETPKKDKAQPDVDMDPINLEVLRSLVE